MIELSFCTWHEVHRQVVLVHLYEVYRSRSDVFCYLVGNQLFDRLHETWLAVSSLGCPFCRPVVQPFCYWIGRDHFLDVMPELAEQFVVETDRPVLAQKLDNIRNEAIVISLANFVEVFDRQANERHKRRDNNLLTTKIGHVLNDAIGVNRKFDVVTFVLFYVVRYQLLTSDSLLQHNFGQRIVGSLDVVVHHITKKSTSSSNRHMKLRQLFLCVFISSQISKIKYLKNLFA